MECHPAPIEAYFPTCPWRNSKYVMQLEAAKPFGPAHVAHDLPSSLFKAQQNMLFHENTDAMFEIPLLGVVSRGDHSL
jgi:hypothetical protein